MLAAIVESPQWFWLSLGGLLLIAEMLGTSGYLLWSGVAAAIIGALVWLCPGIGWAWQGVLFAILVVLVAYLWWYWQRASASNGDGDQTLNQRNRQLIGTRATLTASLHNGLGRITIGDGSWRARATQDLPAGAEVEVIAVEGTTLVIRAVIRE